MCKGVYLSLVFLLLFLFADIGVAFSTPRQQHLCRSCTSRFVVAKVAKSEDECHDVADDGTKAWISLGEIATISSPWVSIYCERLQDNTGQVLDYWRVEKAASCIVLTLTADGQLVLPRPQYRPGVGRETLDFCGGRCDATKPQEAVATILKRELFVDFDRDVVSLVPLNKDGGWIINSSFSNQLLFGFVVQLKEDVRLKKDFFYFDHGSELFRGPHQLTCLQCRSVLMEWMMQGKIERFPTTYK